MLLMISVIPANIFAGALDSKVIVGVTEEYHDNLFFDENHELSSWASSLSSRIVLTNEDDVFKGHITGDFKRTIYDGYHDLDNKDWSVDTDISWFPDEKTSCSASVLFDRNSDIDRYISTTGLLLYTRLHKELNGNITLSRSVYERFSTELNLTYLDESFDGSQGVTEDSTVTGKGVSSGFIFKYDERSSVNVYLGYNANEYAESRDEQIYGSIGMNRSITEAVVFYCSLGSRYTRYTYDHVLEGVDGSVFPPVPLYGEIKKHGKSFVGKLGCLYKTDASELKFSVDESLQPGQNQSLSRMTVDLSYKKKLTGKISYSLSALFYDNKSDNNNLPDSIHSKTVQLLPGLHYAFTDSLSFSGSYIYTEYRSDSHINKKNTFRIMCEYTF